MPRLTGTFSADNTNSPEIAIAKGQSYFVRLTPSPSITGSIALQRRTASPEVYETVATFTAANTGTEYISDVDGYYRLRCIDLDAGTETVAYVLQSLVSLGRRYLVDHRPKIGATSGWTINAANNIGLCATLAASQTESTLVIPINNLEIGTRITDFYPVGQVESAGNTASITVELRKLTADAADVVDASVATTGSVSFTADGILGRITAPCENVNAIVVDGESYYFLVTATTAASTDIALQGVIVRLENGIR
jgi:hypothetical protein